MSNEEEFTTYCLPAREEIDITRDGRFVYILQGDRQIILPEDDIEQLIELLEFTRNEIKGYR